VFCVACWGHNEKNKCFKAKGPEADSTKIHLSKRKYMNTNKLLLSTLSGGVMIFLLSFLLYTHVLADFFQSNMGGVMTEKPVIWAFALGGLAYSFLLAYIYGRWAGIKTFATGAKAGAMIFFILALGFNLMLYGYANIFNLTSTLADTVVFAIIGALTGGVVGWVLGRERAAA
jgi:hypothetical protein